MRRTASRILVAAGTVAATVAALTAVASAVPVSPATPRQGGLTQAGPLAEHGFPAWYRDSNGVRLEACTTLDDPLCRALADEVPNPSQPVSYPDNFPGEFFYQLADATLTLTGGAQASVGMDLEGAWAQEEVVDGDQIVFGRVRVRFPAATGEKYRITHPYGIDELVSVNGAVNSTEDVGTTPGAFGGALSSRIGPFLRWDPAVAPAAPAGYVGDPAVNHRVVGSPYGTNFVKIERIDAAGTVLAEVGRTDVFSIQGRYATNSGVTLDQATYTVGADGKGVVEVYASSDPGQAIEVSGNATMGFRTTRLRGQDGRYYGRLPVTGSVPAGASVEVVNVSDNPVTRKARPLVDVVTVARAVYDAGQHTLTVTAESSDRDSTPGTLTVTGFGPLTAAAFTDVFAPPATVTVTSSKGGSTTVPVTGAGAAMLPDAPVAAAPTPVNAMAGQTVTLDGSGSLGAIDSYAWRQTSGPAVSLTGAGTAKATFAAAATGTYTFELVVTGPGGVSDPMTVTAVISPVVATVANAGPDQSVIRGRTVTLDASASQGTTSVSWRQVSGPTVTLAGATTTRPTFTLPQIALPAAPGPNPNYAVTSAPLTFEVTATGPRGSATDQVVVTAQPETLSNLVVRYRTRGEWRISGTSNLLADQRVAVVLGTNLKGQVIATATVDATGAFDVRPTTPNPGTVTTVSFISATGAQVLAVPITITS